MKYIMDEYVKRETERKELRYVLIMQRIMAVILIICGIMSAIFVEEGIAAALILFFPLGIFLLLTREKVIF